MRRAAGGSAKLTGGTVIAAGSSGMLQDLGGDTEQNYLIVHFGSAKAGGTRLSVLDEAGKELGAFTPARSYTAAIITMKGFEAGARCTVTAGDEKIEARIMEGASIY